ISVTLKDVADIAKEVAVNVEIKESTDVQGRQAESQAQIYQIDLEHADKLLLLVLPLLLLLLQFLLLQLLLLLVLLEGVVIKDPEETATPSIIIHSEPKSKDKRKGITVEEPKPLKKQAQIKQDEAYARELEAELNKTFNWDNVIDHVQRKEKEDNDVMRYQALKRKPRTESQARKNMMIYLRNMDGFKMDYFKGMSYDDICPIFEKKFNSNMAFLCSSSSMEESKNCSWFSKGQKLEIVRILWSAHYHIYNYIDDLAGREKISTYKICKTTTARRIQTRVMFGYILQDQDKDQAG
nr:hypothetical protein [Tanacetum cinerariifolium]